jgi:hypothetical protein
MPKTFSSKNNPMYGQKQTITDVHVSKKRIFRILRRLKAAQQITEDYRINSKRIKLIAQDRARKKAT